jgi:hypothetical protein
MVCGSGTFHRCMSFDCSHNTGRKEKYKLVC